MNARIPVFLAIVSGAGVFSAPATVSKTLPISWNFTDQPVPEYNFRLLHRSRTTVRWFDLAGRVAQESCATLPDSSCPRVADVASTPGGAVVAAVAYIDEQGRRTSAIVWLTPTGQTARVVKLEGFAPDHIRFAPDGTLWAAGRGVDEQLNTLPAYKILRHYDANGVLIGSYVSNTEGPHSWRGGMESFLAVAPDRIGIYSDPDKVFIELTPAGKITGNWKITGLGEYARATGVAFGAAGGIYISVFRAAPSNRAREIVKLPMLYRIDKALGSASPLDAADVGFSPVILGSDQHGVVVYTKGPSVLSWLALP